MIDTARVDVGFAIRFPLAVFDLEAIKRAAYRFSGQVSVEFQFETDAIKCVLRSLSDADAATLEQAFRTEVLDQDLRIRIGKETEPVRNLILSLAFSRTGLQE